MRGAGPRQIWAHFSREPALIFFSWAEEAEVWHGPRRARVPVLSRMKSPVDMRFLALVGENGVQPGQRAAWHLRRALGWV